MPTTTNTKTNKNKNNSKGPIIRKRTDITSQRKRDGLLSYAKNYTSQNGEDGVIKKIFEILSSSTSEENKYAYCVDVGAWDGKHLSNTYSLLNNNNDIDENNNIIWKGILIEADKNRCNELKSLYKDNTNAICLNIEVSCKYESSKSLLNILNNNMPSNSTNTTIDFLCIDVDGSDYWLLHNVLKEQKLKESNNCYKYKIKVICIEFNPTMPNDIIYIPPRDDTIRHGTSLSALYELVKDEYLLIETTVFNAFFILKELYHQYDFYHVAPAPYTTIEELHECSMNTSLYQLYDGTIKLHGCKKLLWHKLPIKEDDIQILKNKEHRIFPFAPTSTDHSEKNDIKLNNNEHENDNDNHPSVDLAIDISSFFDHNDNKFDSNNPTKEQIECSIKLIQTLQRHGGFVYIKVPTTTTTTSIYDNGIKATNTFFSIPNEQIRRSCLSKVDRAKRGYSPRNTENFASLIGNSTMRNDLVRKFRVGPPSTNNTTIKSSLHTPNIFPDENIWNQKDTTSFKHSIEEYYNQMNIISTLLLHAIHIGLTHQYPFLQPYIESLVSSSSTLTSSILTLLNYTRGSRHKTKRKKKKINCMNTSNGNDYYYPYPLVAKHTDVGMFTILLFDQGNSAMLQRKATSYDKQQQQNKNQNDNNNNKSDNDSDDENEEDEEWIDVTLPPINNNNNSSCSYFVVNIGDCLSKLTKSYIPSTKHRVIPMDGYDSRNCLAYFVGLHSDTILKVPLDEKKNENANENEDTISFRTMTFEEWRKERICNVMKVLKKE